jgi:hypothetical protein
MGGKALFIPYSMMATKTSHVAATSESMNQFYKIVCGKGFP